MNSDAGSLEWSLCETTVTSGGVIKQRRLPDQLSNLAERIQLNSRYYLKNNSRRVLLSNNSYCLIYSIFII